MHAYVNPDSPSSGAGYGLIRFLKKENKTVLECWPRDSDVRNPNAQQFEGFPFTIQREN